MKSAEQGSGKPLQILANATLIASVVAIVVCDVFAPIGPISVAGRWGKTIFSGSFPCPDCGRPAYPHKYESYYNGRKDTEFRIRRFCPRHAPQEINEPILSWIHQFVPIGPFFGLLVGVLTPVYGLVSSLILGWRSRGARFAGDGTGFADTLLGAYFAAALGTVFSSGADIIDYFGM